MTVYGEITYVFYMPQDYAELKQFEAENDLSIYKRVEDTIAVRYNYKTNATYPYESKADRKTENSSEKPNNCEECKHWNDTKDGCADRHGCRTTTEDCSTVPTSSKMEQVDKDINVRSKTEPTCDDCIWNVCNYNKVPRDKGDEPQTEPNLILPERMERGEMYEIGDSIVVMNSEDYYDLLCKSWKKTETQTRTQTETQNSNENSKEIDYFRLIDERKMDEKIAKRVKERSNE